MCIRDSAGSEASRIRSKPLICAFRGFLLKNTEYDNPAMKLVYVQIPIFAYV